MSRPMPTEIWQDGWVKDIGWGTVQADPTPTEEELNALQLMADGWTHSAAARRTGKSERWHRRLLAGAVRKLGARSTTNAVAIGVARGLIEARTR